MQKAASVEHNSVEDGIISTLLAIYGINICNQRKMAAAESVFKPDLLWVMSFLKCVSQKVVLQVEVVSMVCLSGRRR